MEGTTALKSGRVGYCILKNEGEAHLARERSGGALFLSTVNAMGMAHHAQQRKDGTLLGSAGIDTEVLAPRGHHDHKESLLVSHIEK